MILKIIESKDNKTLKNINKLKTRKGRENEAAYLVDGLRIVEHALETGTVIRSLIMTQDFKDSIQFDKISHYDGVAYIITMKQMKLLSETDSPQGVMAIVEKTALPFKYGYHLFLDQIQDPGNMGTLIRTADAAGFSGVIIRKGSTDPYSQKALRSSMGSIMSIPIHFTDLEFLNNMKNDYTIYAAALEGAISYKVPDYKQNSILVIGNEARGISEEVMTLSDQRVKIPMKGDVESLNASIAGGILMFQMTT